MDRNKNNVTDPNIETELLELIAGATYFNKLRSSKSANCMYKTKNNQDESLNICTGLFDRVANSESLIEIINDNKQKINNYVKLMVKFNNGVSEKEFADTRGYIFSLSLSHANKELLQEYEDTKEKYEELLNSIYAAAANTSNLTLCINNAYIGSFESDNNTGSYIDVDQINYCDNESKSNENQDNNINQINIEIGKIKQRLNTIIIVLQIIILVLISLFVYKLYIDYNTN